MNRTYIISALVTLAIVLVGYFVMSGIVEKPAAVVNGHSITEEELQRGMASKSTVHTGTDASVSSEAMRSSVLEQLISDELLLQGAREAGVAVSDDELNAELQRIRARGGEEAFREYLRENSISEEEYTRRLRENVMKRRFAEDFIPADEISEEEIREFYSESPMPFMEPELVEIRIVELDTQEAAEAAISEMRSLGKGGFDKVAEKLRDDTASFVSEYGETNPNFYPGEVGQAMKELPAGQYGGPYKGKEGFFLVRVSKRTAERPRTFEEAGPEIKAMLQERRKSAAIIHWIAEKRNSSTIVRN